MERGYVAAYRILGSREESRDACQEAARKALAAASGYQSERPFYPWFYRILKNTCLDRLSRRKRQAAQRSQLLHEGPTHTGAVAEEQVLQQQRFQSVNLAIAGLSSELREILELRHFQDLSYEEMADILGCPRGTVMSRLYRARKALREALLQDPAFAETAFEAGRNA